MKEIKLKCGIVVYVDDEDYERVASRKWYAARSKNGKRIYARTEKKGKCIYMHRFILEATNPKVLVDHKDLNGLNNTRSNLRLCSTSDNCKNRMPRGKSKYMGVCANYKKWQACMRKDGKNVNLGLFDTEEEAALAYNKAVIATGNPFYRINDL